MWPTRWYIIICQNNRSKHISYKLKSGLALSVLRSGVIHIWKVPRTHTHTHTHTHRWVHKTGEIWIRWVDCINILVVISHYSFARCSHWGKLGKGHRVLCYLLQLLVNLQLSQQKCRLKKSSSLMLVAPGTVEWGWHTRESTRYLLLRCGLQINSISIMGASVKTEHSQAPSKPIKSGTLEVGPYNLWFNKPAWWFYHMPEFENYRSGSSPSLFSEGSESHRKWRDLCSVGKAPTNE